MASVAFGLDRLKCFWSGWSLATPAFNGFVTSKISTAKGIDLKEKLLVKTPSHP